MKDKPETNIILYNFLYTIFKRQKTILCLTAITFILVVFGTWLSVPSWDATSKILVRSMAQQQLSLFDDMSVPLRDSAKVIPAANFIQVLYSRDLATEVVEGFGLDKTLEEQKTAPGNARFWIKNGISTVLTSPVALLKLITGAEDQEPNYKEDAIRAFMDNAVKCDLEIGTQVIVLTVSEQEPELASRIANYMADALVKKAVTMDQDSSKNVLHFTDEKLAETEVELIKSEQNLLDYSTKNNIVSIAAEKISKLELIAKVEEDLNTVDASLAETRARIEGMLSQVATQREALSPAMLVASSPTMTQLVENLNTLESGLAGAKARLVTMQQQVAKQTESLTASMVANNPVISALQESLNDLEAQLSAAHARYESDHAPVKQLEAQAAQKREQLKKVLDEIKASEMSVAETIHRNMPIDLSTTMALVQSLEAQIETNRAAIAVEFQAHAANDVAVLNTIHRNMAIDYATSLSAVIALESKRAVLARQLVQLRSEGSDLVVKEMELDRLQRAVDSNRDLHANLLDKHTQLQVQSVFEKGGYDLQIIERAALPKDAKKDSPAWIINIVLGFAASLLVGVGVAFFTEYWVENFRVAKDVEDRIGLPVLCVLADVPKKKWSS